MCVPLLVQELEARSQHYTVEWYSEHSTTQAEHDEINNIRQEVPRELQMQATTISCSCEEPGFEALQCSLQNHR
jgi:vesicle coat complex subunit